MPGTFVTNGFSPCFRVRKKAHNSCRLVSFGVELSPSEFLPASLYAAWPKKALGRKSSRRENGHPSGKRKKIKSHTLCGVTTLYRAGAPVASCCRLKKNGVLFWGSADLFLWDVFFVVFCVPPNGGGFGLLGEHAAAVPSSSLSSSLLVHLQYARVMQPMNRH